MASATSAHLFFLFFFLFTLIVLPLRAVGQNDGNVEVGASLSATTTTNSSWLSPSGDFAFGFRNLYDSHHLFLLSIWYAKIPDTIVWYAGNDGVLAPEGSKLVLTPNSGLVINDPQGNVLWLSPKSAGLVSHGFLNDTGNFVIKDDQNGVLWQSFDHPRDTLLPTQIMETDGVVSSRVSEANFTRGRFQLRLLEDGNFVLNTWSLVTDFSYATAYWMTGTNDPNNSTNSGYRVIYNEFGNMFVLRRNGIKFDLLPDSIVPAKDYYHRATLNFDGVLAWYYHPRNVTGGNNSGWSIIKSVPDNICLRITGEVDSGACGYNNICEIGDDQRPSCKCPPGFSLLDPNDKYGSCKPNFKQNSCEEEGNGGYRLEQLTNTDWPTSDYDQLVNFNAEQCKNSCLNDCFCAVAVFRLDTSTCWKKKLPLSNGRKDSTVTATAFLKVTDISTDDDNPEGPVPPNPDPKSNRKRLNYLVSVLLGTSVFMNITLFAGIGLGIFYFCNRQLSHARGGKVNGENNVRHFSYKELQEATNGFKEELGRGAFGVVYKGMVGSTPDVRRFVAVKKIDCVSSKEADREFKTEVNVIGQTHHKNLVRLIGFCEEEEQRLLVYEFMSNGSLAGFLFGEFKPSWVERVRIAQGVARGLFYLHEECITPIIHCDIKPQNILLDEYHNARISDFGLAKLLMLNQSQTQTVIRGTKGYVAPEWFRNNPVTAKVDVYSYGVLLLEIVCCRRNISAEMMKGEEGAILTDLAADCYQSRTLDALLHDDAEALADLPRLERFVMVALWCVQEDPTMRPTMRRVTQMLEGVVEVAIPPYSTNSCISITA
ncbi:hypothetical protein Nepgr_001920 [Nepenthes gracilis]|uniref:Receptor-like serine/threonine-protein kinase n=1 Tax=Nepenthes gracilis TaxID=150966 RepID=A0AAD3RXV2_NEPGR|nr:hypothetical protein Nepgr_001920 [Nepenthes gracilis]